MKRFEKILVGVDMNADGELDPGSRPAVRQAFELAGQQGAALTFVHVLNFAEGVWDVQELQPQSIVTRRRQQADAMLDLLVDEAQQQDVVAGKRLQHGKDWQQLIRVVLEDKHDLVLVGARSRGLVGRALFGSTSGRLLRYCPSPVWCVKNRLASEMSSVLVAHDLTETGSEALAAGAAIANDYGRQLHVLHVLELPEDRLFLGTTSSSELERREAMVRQEIQQQCDGLHCELNNRVAIETGNAHACILDYLNKHEVDLLCMGTVARGGLQGLIIGNTAENVLPWSDCSLLTVKPEGYVSPLALESGDIPMARTAGRVS